MQGRCKVEHFLLICDHQGSVLCWNKHYGQLPRTVRLRQKPRLKAHKPSKLMCAPRLIFQGTTELPRYLAVGNSGMWKFTKRLSEDRGVMSESVPSLIKFLSRWPGCERKSPGWEVSSNWIERFMLGIIQWHGQIDNAVLNPSKRKIISNLQTLRRQMAKTYKLRETGLLSVLKTDGRATLLLL